MPRLIEIILAILVAVLGGVVLVMWPERPGSPAEPEPVETEAPVLPDGEADPGSEPVEPEPISPCLFLLLLTLLRLSLIGL